MFAETRDADKTITKFSRATFVFGSWAQIGAEPPAKSLKWLGCKWLGERQRYLPKEVPATLQLYLDGKMEQFWLRDKEEGVIFLMNVDSVDEADRLLKALPLGQDNLLTFDLMPIGPLLLLGMLMK
jgi:hypothetical protein